MKAHYSIYCSIDRPKSVMGEELRILNIVCRYTGVPLNKITTSGRKQEVVDAKHIARYMIYHYTHNSLLKVITMTGGINHTTTLHSLNACEDLVATNKSFRNVFNQIESVVKLTNKRVEKIDFNHKYN